MAVSNRDIYLYVKKSKNLSLLGKGEQKTGNLKKVFLQV